MKTRVWLAAGISLALLASVGPVPLSAQAALRGGINLTDFFGDDAGTTSPKTGLNFGAAFPLFTIGPVQLVAEGYHRQKGATQSFEDIQAAALAGQPIGTFEIGLDYIEVPVLARINLPVVGRRILPYLSGGPAFAWKVDCGVTASDAGGGGLDCDDFSSENLGETLANHERGLVIGGGFDIAVGSIGAVNIDARLTRGLSRLAADSDGPDVRNQAFSVMLGYSFGLPGALGAGGMSGTNQ